MMSCETKNHKKFMYLNIPNTLTLFRIGLIPAFMVVFYLPYDWARPVSAWFFGVIAITDWFDGYLARKLNQQSALGAFLDPVADKLIVAVALIMITAAHPEMLIILGSIIIIGREITISALREWMAQLGKKSTVSVSSLGKVKTTAQLFAIGFLLHRDDWLGIPTHTVGVILLGIAAALTVISMVIYLKAAWQVVKEDM